MEPDQITAWISEKRFAPFLERAGGEEALADRLYLWHAQVAGAGLTTLHHFEPALRNAIDRRLGAGEPDLPLEETWLLDQETLSAQGIAKVRGVLGRLEREGYPRERPRVFWFRPGQWRTYVRCPFGRSFVACAVPGLYTPAAGFRAPRCPSAWSRQASTGEHRAACDLHWSNRI